MRIRVNVYKILSTNECLLQGNFFFNFLFHVVVVVCFVCFIFVSGFLVFVFQEAACSGGLPVQCVTSDFCHICYHLSYYACNIHELSLKKIKTLETLYTYTEDPCDNVSGELVPSTHQVCRK